MKSLCKAYTVYVDTHYAMGNKCPYKSLQMSLSLCGPHECVNVCVSSPLQGFAPVFHQQSYSSGCGVELRDSVLLNDLPQSGHMRIHRHTFKLHHITLIQIKSTLYIWK